MSYGCGCKSLSPCSPEDIFGVLSELKLSPKSILDAGCGRGERLAFFGGRFPGAGLRGIEPDAENAAAARKSCPQADIAEENLESYAGPGAELVLCECTLSLLPDASRGAKSLCGMTEPGGTLILSDLFFPGEEGSAALPDGKMLRSIHARGFIEELFLSQGMELESFCDRRGDMIAMACQMIMDGVLCENVGAESLELLRRTHAGYGVWVFRK